ncbi:MAG: hypothetical protein KTR14_11650 [Vampirovibrio sp.]|nr:hypothetical protein [Vampirovibrio sp.]
MSKFAPILLLIGGAAHAIPPFYAFLTDLSGGTPVIQIVVGVASMLAGISMFGRTSAPALG